MKTAMLYHNPRCSKSREAIALLDEAGLDYDVRLYLNEPLSVGELALLKEQLGLPASRLLRTREKEYADAGLGENSSDTSILEAIAQFPKLMEPPILVTDKGARIGRPPETIREIL